MDFKDLKEKPVVLVGCPIRNRDWIAERYLQGIYNLNFDKKQIILYFLLNDSTDSTEQILKRFQQLHKHEYKDFIIDKVKNRIPEYRRSISMNPNMANLYWEKVYTNIANLRNKVIDKVLELQADYWFSVDSDILIDNPETLNILINEGKGKFVISGVINNDQLRNPHLPLQQAACNFLNFNEHGKVYHITGWNYTDLIECCVTGAVCLYSCELFKQYPNIRFCYDRGGEDVGLGRKFQEAGLKMYVTPKVICNHVMAEGLFEICSQCSNVCRQYQIMHGERQPEIISCPKFKEKV
jgi:hypothetical protein